MKTAIYPGSFDPVTKGHLDVLERAASIFDKVIIVVSVNTSKQSFIPAEDRIRLIKECVEHLKNVEVDSYDGLTVNYAKSKGADVLIRGLRAVSDFEYEMQLSQVNNALDSDINTVFLITKPEYNFISSSTIREIAIMRGDISKFVPAPVRKFLEDKYMKG